MTFKPSHAEQAFVWVWLPNTDEPVVAGRIHQQGNLHYFTYGVSLLHVQFTLSKNVLQAQLIAYARIPSVVNTGLSTRGFALFTDVTTLIEVSVRPRARMDRAVVDYSMKQCKLRYRIS